MIEVQVRAQDDVDVRGVEACITDAVLEPRRLTCVQHTVDVGELLAVLVADPRIDQHERIRRFDKEAPERQRDPITVVCRNPAFPERLRHHTEHGTAVELLNAGLDTVDADRSDFCTATERKALVHQRFLLDS